MSSNMTDVEDLVAAELQIFPFEKLPAELRNRICRFAISKDVLNERLAWHDIVSTLLGMWTDVAALGLSYILLADSRGAVNNGAGNTGQPSNEQSNDTQTGGMYESKVTELPAILKAILNFLAESMNEVSVMVGHDTHPATMGASQRMRHESSYVYYKHNSFAFDSDLRSTSTDRMNATFEQ